MHKGGTSLDVLTRLRFCEHWLLLFFVVVVIGGDDGDGIVDVRFLCVRATGRG